MRTLISLPASVFGCLVSLILTCLAIWTTHLCILELGKRPLIADNMPFCPSQTIANGFGIGFKNVLQEVEDSDLAKVQLTTCFLVLPIKATTFLGDTETASITKISLSKLSGIIGNGMLFQNIENHRFNVRKETLYRFAISESDVVPHSQSINRLWRDFKVISTRSFEKLRLHILQCHRCLPEDVLPRFWTIDLHLGQCFFHPFKLQKLNNLSKPLFSRLFRLFYLHEMSISSNLLSSRNKYLELRPDSQSLHLMSDCFHPALLWWRFRHLHNHCR